MQNTLGFHFLQDATPSHISNLVEGYLQEQLGETFFAKAQWLPQSPNVNPLDYHFWNAVKEKMYEGRRQPFATLHELQERIVVAWNAAVRDGSLILKAVTQFRPRLQAIVIRHGHSIKADFA